MKYKRELRIKYSYVDYERKELQKRLDDAFDSLFEEVEIKDVERINNKNVHEHTTAINR